MSWLFSRALVEEFSEACSSDTILYALSNEMSGVSMFLCNGKTSEFSLSSRFGMTSAHLTENLGVELWTWFLADSSAKHSLLLQEEETLQKKTYGEKCIGLLEKYALHLSLQKMFPKSRSRKQSLILKVKGTELNTSNYQRQTWVQITYGTDIGYLHTPTTMANFAAPSMQKHKCCQNYVTVFGKVNHLNMEWLMGWPTGWSGTEPLEMDKFQLWRQSHLQGC